MLYSTNDTANTQLRYILYDRYLEDRYPVCGQGMVDDPGSCAEYFGIEEDTDTDTDDSDQGQEDDETRDGLFGCGTPLAPAMAPTLLGLLGLTLRRRRERRG